MPTLIFFQGGPLPTLFPRASASGVALAQGTICYRGPIAYMTFLDVYSPLKSVYNFIGEHRELSCTRTAEQTEMPFGGQTRICRLFRV